MSAEIRVLLVEDHPEYRDVIELALDKEKDIRLVGKVGSFERAVFLLRQGVEVPEIILLDLNLPGASGHEAIPEFQTIVAGIEIIVLTQSGQESDVLQAIQLGAAGYLLKSSTAMEIIDAIRTVASGGAIIDSKIARFVFNSIRKREFLPEQPTSLSPRELEILKMLGEGLVKKEIASELSISVNSVATYIRRIYEKLNVQNAPAAITKAFRKGILPRDD